MNQEHRNILRRNRVALLIDLEPLMIINFLFQEEYFSEQDLELVNSLSTRQEKVEKLLDILPRRGPKAFNAFHEFLSSSQKHLADLLKAPAQENSPPAGLNSSTPSTRLPNQEPNGNHRNVKGAKNPNCKCPGKKFPGKKSPGKKCPKKRES